MIFVGIPVLNRRDLLERAVASIDVPHHLYIVDNSVVNRGVAASWNAIIRQGFEAGYRWIFIGSNDCFLDAGSLAKGIAVLDTDRVGIWHLHEDNFNWFLISRETVERVGWFDEQFWPVYHEDCDYAWRCHLAGVIRRHVPGANCEHHHGGSNTIRAGFAGPSCREYYVRKWGGPPGSERFSMPFVDPEARADRRRVATAKRRA